MKNNHTPAPWFTLEYAGTYYVQDSPYYEGNILTDVDYFKNAQYNAQLMSAAPELLEVTKTMLEFIEGLNKPKTRTYDPDYKNNIDNMIADAKAAIEKATTICSH